MLLSKLNILHLRNIHDLSVHCHPGANVLFGDNGSGKTSFLESIYILGRGRSFKHRDLRLVIESGQAELVVSAQILSDPSSDCRQLGVKRTIEGRFEARYDGVAIDTASELAAELPLQLIDAHSFLLLEGGAMQRRQFVDWGVFHVEPGYAGLWRRFQKALKQRNQLLRHDRIEPEQLAVWTREFVALSDAIAVHRDNYLAELQAEVVTIAHFFDGLGELHFEHERGWSREQTLDVVMAADNGRDCKFGKTHHGAHRGDLKVRVDGVLAGERLSRGQLKLLIYALKLAQAALYRRKAGQACVFLLDDLPAELDYHHREQVIECLNGLGCQYFMTGVDKRDFVSLVENTAHQMFHVEHGVVTAQSITGS